MTDPSVMPVVAQLALVAFPFLLGIVMWFIRNTFADVRAKAIEEREATEESIRDVKERITKESGERMVELQAITERVHNLQREVDKEYVNFERLHQTIQPLQTSVDSLAKAVIEGQRELFNRIDGKQDKQRG